MALQTAEIAIEHPAGAGVLVDWATFIYPKDKWAAKNLDAATSLRFVTTDGQSLEAYAVADRGQQGKVIKVIGSWLNSSIIRGDLVSSTLGASLADYVDGAGVGESPTPTILGGVYNYVSTENVRNSTVEQIDRLIFAPDAAPAAGDGRKTQIHLYRVKRALHPVVDYFIVPTNQGEGVGTTGRPSSDITFTVDFGDGSRVYVMPDSNFAEVSGGGGGNTVTISELGLDHGSIPSFHVRVHYVLDEDVAADEGAENYITTSLRSIAHFPPAVGMYQNYGTNVAGGARWLTMGVRPDYSTTDRDRYVQEMEDFYRTVEQRSVYATRVHAQGLSTNASGAQRYGWSATGAIFGMTPRQAYRFLRNSAEDELLRGVAWYQDTGARITDTTNAATNCSNRNLHSSTPVGAGRINLGVFPPRKGLSSNRTADDAQHVDDLTAHAFLALFDDPDIYEWQRQVIYREAQDSRVKNGWINGAARGFGRPLFALATAQWLMDGTTEGTTCLNTIKTWMTNLGTNWQGAAVEAGANPNGVIKPVRTKRDARMPVMNPVTDELLPAGVPYENATCVVALAAIAIIMDAVGDAAVRTQALDIGWDIIVTMGEWAIITRSAETKFPYAVGTYDQVTHAANFGLNFASTYFDERVTPNYGWLILDGRSNWTRWGAAAALMVPWYESAGSKSRVGTRMADVYDGLLRTIVTDNGGDEKHRFTAVPRTLAEAPLLPAA